MVLDCYSLMPYHYATPKVIHLALGSSYSDLFNQEMGLPQGSILLVTKVTVLPFSPDVTCVVFAL